MTSTLAKLSDNSIDVVLAYLARISTDLTPQDQLKVINNMLAVLSDLKACEGVIQARKNKLTLQTHNISSSTETSPLTVVKNTLIENDDRNVSIDWVVNYTSRSKSTIYRWVCDGKIPHSKPGKNLVFNTGEIKVWFQQFRKLTKEERRTRALKALGA